MLLKTKLEICFYDLMIIFWSGSKQRDNFIEYCVPCDPMSSLSPFFFFFFFMAKSIYFPSKKQNKEELHQQVPQPCLRLLPSDLTLPINKVPSPK